MAVPGHVTRHMWVLSDGLSPKVHSWPDLQGVLAAEYIAKVIEVSVYSKVLLLSQQHKRTGTNQSCLVIMQAKQTHNKEQRPQALGTEVSTVRKVGNLTAMYC